MKFFFLSFLVLISFFGYSQVHRQFYDQQDQQTDSISSYYYIEGRPGSGVNLEKLGLVNADTVYSYYTTTGKIKGREIYSKGLLHGPFVLYHRNGRIREKGLYASGVKKGYVTSWYESGQPSRTLQYSGFNGADQSRLINYWDSLGNQIVKDGAGYCRCYGLPGHADSVREEGRVVAGLRDSTWSRFIHARRIDQRDYQNGKLQWSVDGMGEVIYIAVDEQPEFPGGIQGMMAFLKRHMFYPPEARRKGIEGRVFVGFIVGNNGEIRNVTVVKGISSDCDLEAMRVISKMPNWKPGKYRGTPVAVRYVLPVNFALQ